MQFSVLPIQANEIGSISIEKKHIKGLYTSLQNIPVLSPLVDYGQLICDAQNYNNLVPFMTYLVIIAN